MARVLVPLAQGCEELEAVTVIDLLRRAEIEVITASLDGKPVHASRGTVLIADQSLSQVLEQEFDMIVLPGGLPGADNLNADSRIHSLIQTMAAAGKKVAAICAAPRVLADAGVLDGKRATGYPGILEGLARAAVDVTGASVERDQNVITSRGPGTAMDFALTLIESLTDKERRNRVEEALVR